MVQPGQGLRLYRRRRWQGRLRPLLSDPGGRVPQPRRRPARRVRDHAERPGTAGREGRNRLLRSLASIEVLDSPGYAGVIGLAPPGSRDDSFPGVDALVGAWG